MRSLCALLLFCYFSCGHAQQNNNFNITQTSSRLPLPHDVDKTEQKSQRSARSTLKPSSQHNPSVDRSIATPTFKAQATPVITGVAESCVRPGDILNFTGKDLFTLAGSLPLLTLDEGNNAIPLRLLNVTNNRITVQVSGDHRLQPNHTYPVYLLENKQIKSYQNTKLVLRTCFFTSTTFKEKASPHYELGEILIFTDKQQAFTIRQNSIKLDYTILRDHELVGLNKTMLILSVQEAMINGIISALRQQYPSAKIDLNHHYQPAAAARTYASSQIAWSDSKHRCYSDYYKDITIGIIDSDVDQLHPVLAEQNITVKNFLQETEQTDSQHGTAIAAILVGDRPELGFQGLMSGITIMAASVIRQDQKGLVATTESLVRSLDWLIVEEVRLINISLSGTAANSILKYAFQIGIKKGLIIFAAAGNHGSDSKPAYPAALPGVIAVTAIDVALRGYTQANQGKYIDFSAPGVDIWTIDKDLQGKYRSGTSFAAPHVLAVAALYLSRKPALSRDVLYSEMQADSHDLGIAGHDTVFGWGLIQTPKIVCRN